MENKYLRMPNIKTFVMIASLISSTMIFFACKKGDPGTPGQAGADGPAGPKGEPGAAGPTGTANVIYSSWKYATNFNDSTIDNSALKVGYVAASDLSATILNSGLVMIYFTYGGGTFTLPYTSNAGGKPNTISFTPMLKKILVYRFAHDNSNSIALSTLLQYRYIIVPGGLSASRVANYVDYTNMSYEEVCKKLNIPL
jgi:hypothetical protein